MTKMHQIYQALAGFGANSPEKAMTANELSERGGLKDIKYVSTGLSQMAITKRGVLSRDLTDTGVAGAAKQWKYWVVGPFQGRGVTSQKKRTYVKRQAGQVKVGPYKVTISGPDLIIERMVSNGLLTRVINALIEQ
jgi:hypothetical protein